MSKSVIVVQDKDKFKVMVCFVQRGIELNSAELANKEAQRVADHERIDNVILYQNNPQGAQG